MASTKPSAIGEIEIELEGVAYRLRPSFQAIREIEQALGHSILEVASAAETGKMSLDDAGVVVAACIRAEAKANGDTALATIKPARAAELIYGEPGGLLLAVRVCIYPLLFGAVMGRYQPTGEPRPSPTKTR
jgi:hypothetical protein